MTAEKNNQKDLVEDALDCKTPDLSLEDREAVEIKMDRFFLKSTAWTALSSPGTIDIEIIDDDHVTIHVKDFFGNVDITSRLIFDDAKSVISAIHNLHTEEWTEEFRPETYSVLDGYSWVLTISSGETSYYSHGDNACPECLVNFLHLLPKYGLPLMWNDGEMLFESRDN